MSTVPLPPKEMRPLAVERYQALGAQTFGDGPGWLLAGLEQGKATMWDELELVARVRTDGRSGWDVAADPAVCPDGWLPWAAQFGGVRIDPASLVGASSEYLALERARAVERPALYTGLTSTILSAVRRYLVPGGTLIFRPRFDPEQPSIDSAYHLTVVVRRASVLPQYIHGDASPELLAAFLGELPAGLVGHLRISDERDWQEVLDTWPGEPGWQGVLDDNTDWADVLTP